MTRFKYELGSYHPNTKKSHILYHHGRTAMPRVTKQNGNKPSDKKPRRAEVGTSTAEQLYSWTFLYQNLVMSNSVIFEKM